MAVQIIDNFSDLIYTGDKVLSKDQPVFTLTGQTFSVPTQTSIQIGRDQHIEDEDGAFINHHCHPSCYIQDGAVYVVNRLHKGDSITFDYNVNEDTVSHPFICNCCQTLIRGRNFKK